MAVTDWEPERYGAFRDMRLRPALNLLAQGHPVRAFTESTAMRPYVAAMTPDEAGDYVAANDAALAAAYPSLPDGRVLFSFTRVFFILERP